MSQVPKLLDQVQELLRIKHYTLHTEYAYINWIRRYILFYNNRHPLEMCMAEVRAFLAHLAVEKHVSASTQTQPLSVLLFLYREVLHIDLPDIGLHSIRAKKPNACTRC